MNLHLLIHDILCRFNKHFLTKEFIYHQCLHDVDDKNLNKDLDVSNNFVVGPIKDSEIVIQNINSEFSIIHVATEKNI